MKFKPEHLGQLKFYVTAVDKQMRTEADNPTIALLICKDKNDVVAEYTLSEIVLLGFLPISYMNNYQKDIGLLSPALKR